MGEAASQLSFRTDALRVLSAELHPFRHAPTEWPTLIERLAGLGVSHVTTLMPWGEHEAREGEFDFGERRSALAIGAFLDLVEAAGLRAIVRIGPRVRADLSFAGLPEHVVYDRSVMARSARGSSVPSPMPARVFPWPSYSSDTYRRRVAAYFAAAASVLAPRIAPLGVVDAIDVEDASAVLLRAGAYARDYHPDATRAFQQHLETEYGSPSALSAAWGVRVGAFSDVSAPTRFAADTPRDLPRHLDWVAFQEATVCEFREFLKRSLVAAGLGACPLSTTLDANALEMPGDPRSAANVVDRVGAELTSRSDELSSVRRRVSPLAFASERPFVRVVAGGSPFGRARSDDDTLASILLGVAFGAREVELSMGVDHERWWGAPIGMDGTPSALAERIQRLMAALADLEIERLTSRPDVVIVVPPEYLRLTRVTHLFGPLGAGILDFVGRSFAEATLEGRFGFDRPIQHALFDCVRSLEDALDASHVAFSLIDPRTLGALDAPPRLLLVPTFDFLDATSTEALRSATSAGSRLLVGPVAPRLDGRMDPWNSTAPLGELLVHESPSRLAQAIEDALGQLGMPRLAHDTSSAARAYPLRSHRGIVAHVLANPGCADGTIVLESDVIDPVSGEAHAAGMPIPSPAGSVRLAVRTPSRDSQPPRRTSTRPAGRRAR